MFVNGHKIWKKSPTCFHINSVFVKASGRLFFPILWSFQKIWTLYILNSYSHLSQILWKGMFDRTLVFKKSSFELPFSKISWFSNNTVMFLQYWQWIYVSSRFSLFLNTYYYDHIFVVGMLNSKETHRFLGARNLGNYLCCKPKL